MSAPVTTDDIVTGCVKFLKAKGDVLAAVGETVIDGQLVPLIFGYSMWWQDFQNSSMTAAFITSDGGWAGPNLHNTLRFPRITLNIWCDPLRDAGGNIADPHEVMLRANRAYEIVDNHLHRPEGETQWWGQIRTVSCARLTEPTTYRVPDGDGIVRLSATYAVTQG